MPPITPDGVPSEVYAGDTWKWRTSDLSEYPQSEGWALKYSLVGIDAEAITATWTTSGVDANHWVVTLATGTTKRLGAGRYDLIAYVDGSGTYAGLTHHVSRSVVLVHADPREASPADYQTHSEKMVKILRDSIEGVVSTDKMIETYGVAGRQVIRIPYKERVKMLSGYQSQLRQQREGTMGRLVRARF